jgi:hypothetical protein
VGVEIAHLPKINQVQGILVTKPGNEVKGWCMYCIEEFRCREQHKHTFHYETLHEDGELTCISPLSPGGGGCGAALVFRQDSVEQHRSTSTT